MATRTPTVKFGENYDTQQIYSRGFEFAFMARLKGKRIYEQATTFVYCKDFLHDAIWAFLNKTKVSIWGFKYDYEKDKPLQMDRTALTFRNTQYQKNPEEFHERRAACLEFLHGVESVLKFRPTQIHPVEHEAGPCWLILADKRWQLAPTLISLYTLFVRLGFFHTPGESIDQTIERAEKGKIKIGSDDAYAGNRDCSYIKQARKGIDTILRHGTEIFHPTLKENYPKSLLKNGLHDNYGIVNFTQRKPEKTMPHWYRDEIWK